MFERKHFDSNGTSSWEHDITTNETEILEARLRDFVRSSHGFGS